MNQSLEHDHLVDGTAPLAEQIAAVCWRKNRGKVEILLITSRDTGRWVIPKGWKMADCSDATAAKTEAWQEAGVEGDISAAPLGQFDYDKVLRPGAIKRCRVEVFGLRVKSMKDRFPERKERSRKWFTLERAARKVAEPELRELISGWNQIVT
jgi:8-oxo-dGTP pyrophosphatase MutT (NUDIX family)